MKYPFLDIPDPNLSKHVIIQEHMVKALFDLGIKILQEKKNYKELSSYHYPNFQDDLNQLASIIVYPPSKKLPEGLKRNRGRPEDTISISKVHCIGSAWQQLGGDITTSSIDDPNISERVGGLARFYMTILAVISNSTEQKTIELHQELNSTLPTKWVDILHRFSKYQSASHSLQSAVRQLKKIYISKG